MKKFYTILLSMLFFHGAMAQDDQHGLGRLEAYKIAYLTKKLNLSPQEAQQFWPIYNKYQQEIKSARSDVKTILILFMSNAVAVSAGLMAC